MKMLLRYEKGDNSLPAGRFHSSCVSTFITIGLPASAAFLVSGQCDKIIVLRTVVANLCFNIQ